MFVARDAGGATARFTLSLWVDEARRLATGSGDLLFVVGGNDGGLRNDVWRSTDGVNWVSVTVAGDVFSGRDRHEVVSYRGNLWVIGGWDGVGRLNDVWRSTDGVVWTSVAAAGDVFSGRWGHQAVAYGDNLWVIGGRDSRGGRG